MQVVPRDRGTIRRDEPRQKVVTVTDRADMTIGGLTLNQRKRLFSLEEKFRQAHLNFCMRLNDTTSRSWRSRTLSAKKMADICAEIYRTVART